MRKQFSFCQDVYCRYSFGLFYPADAMVLVGVLCRRHRVQIFSCCPSTAKSISSTGQICRIGSLPQKLASYCFWPYFEKQDDRPHFCYLLTVYQSTCNVHFPNFHDMFIMLNASLGFFLDIWTKSRWLLQVLLGLIPSGMQNNLEDVDNQLSQGLCFYLVVNMIVPV